jgi:transcriptional regulator with XRE-family HTH domain
MNTGRKPGVGGKKRGRAAGSRKTASTSPMPVLSSYEQEAALLPSHPREAVTTGQIRPTTVRETSDDEQLAYTLPEEKLTPFSSLLRHILRRDHVETARVAKAVGVTENTIYRWLNGSSEPRLSNLRQLLDALPEHRANLAYAINLTFSHILDEQQEEQREISKGIYQQVLELVAHIREDQERIWRVQQLLFEHALLLLDHQHQGMSITYAAVMPPRDDGSIRSLREAAMRGTYPWPSHYEDKVFLGSTTLAGHAAMQQRLCIWHDLEEEERFLVAVDDYERSACACPVMRCGLIAGVLIVSSVDPTLFRNEARCQMVNGLARLLSVALREYELWDPTLLRLVPMPDLSWQRQKMSDTFMNRSMQYIRKYTLSHQEAEQRVIQEMELEFEEEGQRLAGQQNVSSDSVLESTIKFLVE